VIGDIIQSIKKRSALICTSKPALIALIASAYLAKREAGTSREICLLVKFLGIPDNYCRAVLSSLRKRKFLAARRLLGGAYVWKLLTPLDPLELSKLLRELANACWEEWAPERQLLESLAMGLRGESPSIIAGTRKREMPEELDEFEELEAEAELEEEEMWLAKTREKEEELEEEELKKTPRPTRAVKEEEEDELERWLRDLMKRRRLEEEYLEYEEEERKKKEKDLYSHRRGFWLRD